LIKLKKMDRAGHEMRRGTTRCVGLGPAILFGNFTGTHNLGYLVVEGKIILKRNLKAQVAKM
jgi:hypothetical protein